MSSYYTFIITIILFLPAHAFVETNGYQELPKSVYNAEMLRNKEYSKECSTYTECHMCALSGC